jgi:hypothetical protein
MGTRSFADSGQKHSIFEKLLPGGFLANSPALCPM